MTVAWTEATKDIAGTKMFFKRAGSGPTVLVLHRDIGTPDSLAFYDALAEKFDVIVSHHPGWGKSERAEWMRHPRDIAAMNAWLLTGLGVSDASLVGLGFGGWIAAEMASLAPTQYRRLVLVGSMGINPPDGYITDQALLSYLDYPRMGFHNEAAFTAIYGDVSVDQLEAWDLCREMSFRTAWKPYMYSQTLPHLLGGVQSPALIIHGDDDRIVPISASHVYAKALRNATMTVVAECGHCAEMDQPAAVAKLITQFVAS